MFDAEKYIAEYQELEHGAARLRIIKKAIAAADEAQDAHWRFVFRHRYVHESIFESDALDALVVFPEMLAVFDENPDTQEEYLHDLMWDFKNVLCNLPNFPQVSLSQMEELLNDYGERCKKYGYTQRTVKYLREKHSYDTGNLLLLAEYGTYAQEGTDELQDCPACEANWNVQCELLRGNREKAEQLSQPLFNRELHCAEVPEETYAVWVDYLQKQGDYHAAQRYAKRLYPMVRGRIELLDCIADLLRFYAKFDRHTGGNIFRRELNNYLTCRDLMHKMEFAMSAYHLFNNMESEDITLILPREFPMFNEEHHYVSAELSKYFYDEAAALAARFDERNGNSYYTDKLNYKFPDFDEEAVDFIHGDAPQSISAFGAVCKNLPDTMTLESVKNLLEADGKYHVELMRAEQEQGILHFQINEDDSIYQIVFVVEQVPPLDEFRPAMPIKRDVMEAASKAEGCVMCVMPFEEHQPDRALHLQMRMMHLVCPDALLYLDLSREKAYPAKWFAMAAQSNIPPLVDYLYNLQLLGDNDGAAIWIMTKGMHICGLRELEIWDANKENYGRLCDLLCFTIERFLLRGEIPDAGTPFEALRLDDGSSLRLAWLPASQALAYYDGADCGCTKYRAALIGEEDANAIQSNGVLFLYDGENADGSAKLKRLNTLTEDDFTHFRYGQYIATGNKIAALAKERFPIFCDCFAKYPEEVYVNVHVEIEDDEDDIWMQVTAIKELSIYGKLCNTCLAGNEGEEYVADMEDLLDYSIRLENGMKLAPNTLYLFE